MIKIESTQHSTGSATAAPQISPLFPPVNSSNDTWSLSYTASDNISRTTTFAAQPSTDTAAHEQLRYASLGPPEYAENAVGDKDRLMSPPAPSPQVSALGSTNHDDIPSRSISEVTRPEEEAGDASSNRSHLLREGQTRTDREADAVRPSNLSTRSPHRSRPASPHDPRVTTSLASSDASLAALIPKTSEAPSTVSSEPSYSQPATGAQLRAGSTQLGSMTGISGPETESLSASLGPRRSVVSAISCPSPGPPLTDHNAPSPSITRPGSTPGQQKVDEKRELPVASSPTKSPPYEDATPHSATINIKEAEAAAESSLLASSDHRQSLLPAYQSPIQEKPPPQLFQPPAIIPITDLSARRREDERGPPSRPFSFMDTHHEGTVHRHTASKDSQLTSGTDSSLSKELGIDENESGNREYSRLYTRPLDEASLGLHPALRGSNENRQSSQDRDFTPPHRSPDHRPQNRSQQQQEQQYRIPGPYGQKFKVPQPIVTSSSGGRSFLQQPPKSAPAAGYPSMVHDRQRSSEIAVAPRPQSTEYGLPSIRPPRSAEPLNSAPKPHTGAARLFRLHSSPKSPLTHNDASDLVESPFKEERKKERRSSMFRPRSREASESKSAQANNMKGDAGRSQSALEFYQRSPDVQAQGTLPNGTKAKGKEQKLSKKLQRVIAPNNQPPTENRKKGGFRRLSGLFGKSAKEGIPPAKEEPVQRTVPPQALFSPPPSMGPGPVKSTPFQETQAHWRSRDQPRHSDDRRSNSFRGQTPPAGGYYAPGSQILDAGEKPPLPPPRDPDAFIGGRRLSEQRAAEQAGLVANFTTPRNQAQAEKPYHVKQPQQPHAIVQPHSAPASTQHFTTSTTTQTTTQQQPRTSSQRSPPDLRIDTTSSRLNPNRRSQPVPSTISGATTNVESSSRGPPPFSEIAPPNIMPAHSSSNPQRHSPYTDRNSQHSPYGYGSARGLRKDNLSHAIDLHKRSRSPRNGRRESFDSRETEGINAQDPANKLGTFRQTQRSRSQRGGESGEDDDGQEKPWMIDLPVEDAQGNLSRSGKAANNDDNNKGALLPAELQGSKANGDAGSDDEIVMSSTAYPGQEWVPEVHGYGHWDDHV